MEEAIKETNKEEVSTKKPRAKNFTMFEDLLLAEGVEKHGKKWPLVKEYMETTAKDSRPEDEITNRWNNIWKTKGPYWEVYQRKIFKASKKLKQNPKKLMEEQDIFAQQENKTEETHNKIRGILLALKKKDSAGTNTDIKKDNTQVDNELTAIGQERKQSKDNKWGDVKVGMETDRKQRAELIENIKETNMMLKEAISAEKEFLAAFTGYINVKRQKLQE